MKQTHEAEASKGDMSTAVSPSADSAAATRPVESSNDIFGGHLDPVLQAISRKSSPPTRSASPSDAAMSSLHLTPHGSSSPPQWNQHMNYQPASTEPTSPFDGAALPALFDMGPATHPLDKNTSSMRDDPSRTQPDPARQAFKRSFEVEVEPRQPTSELSSPTEVAPKGTVNKPATTQRSAVTGTGQGDIPAPARPKKSHARKQPPGHIPRPRNAFILFRKHITDNNLIPTTVEVKHQNISIVASKIWSEAPSEVKAEFSEAARIEKEEHARLYPNYRYQPAYRRTDIVRRRVRKDANEDQKCDAVANLLIQGKAGEVLEDEIKEQIASVSPEASGPNAVKLVVKRGRRRRKEMPGELSKGAIRAQAAQARARAMRESWAESGFLIASSDAPYMEPKNRYDFQQGQRYMQEQRMTRSMFAGRQNFNPGMQLEGSPLPGDNQGFDQAHYDPYQYNPAGAMSNDGDQSWPPSPSDQFAQQNRYPGYSNQPEQFAQGDENYQGAPSYRPDSYDQDPGQPQSPFENGPNIAFQYQGSRAPDGYHVPQEYAAPPQPAFMSQTYSGPPSQAIYPRYDDPYQQHFPPQPRLEAWSSPSQAQFPAAMWEQSAAQGFRQDVSHPISPITPSGEAGRSPFPADYTPVARPADIIAGHWIRDRDDEMAPIVSVTGFSDLAGSALPADNSAPEDISALIPFIEPGQMSEDVFGNPSHGIDFGHQGELFGGELMRDKDVDLQGYEDALRHNHDSLLLRL